MAARARYCPRANAKDGVFLVFLRFASVSAREFEIEEWKDFRNALENELEKEAFEELMDMCRRNAMASGAACNTIIFEPMVMSILLAHQKKIIELEHKLSVH
jgi:hypothetical protein